MNEKGNDDRGNADIIPFVKVPDLDLNISEYQIDTHGILHTINANIKKFNLKISVDFATHIQHERERLKLDILNVVLMIIKLSAIWKMFIEDSGPKVAGFINKKLPIALSKYSIQMYKNEIENIFKETLTLGLQNTEDDFIEFLDIALTKIYGFQSANTPNTAEQLDFGQVEARGIVIELAHNEKAFRFSTLGLYVFDPEYLSTILTSRRIDQQKEKLNEIVDQLKDYFQLLAQNALNNAGDNEINPNELNKILIDALEDFYQKASEVINSFDQESLKDYIMRMQRLTRLAMALCAHTRDINSVFKYANKILSILKDLKCKNGIVRAGFIDDTIDKIKNSLAPAKNSFLDIIRQALRDEDISQVDEQKRMFIYSTKQYVENYYLNDDAKKLCKAIWYAQIILKEERVNDAPDAPYITFELFRRNDN